MPAEFYRSRRPQFHPSMVNDTPLRQVMQQEAEAADVVNQQALQQDIIQEQERAQRKAQAEINAQQAQADKLARESERAQKINLQRAKARGMETEIDPSTAIERVRTNDDGTPIWQAGFLDGPKPGDDGAHVVTYRDPRGQTYKVPLQGIDRTEDPTGAFYEFNLPSPDGQVQRIRRPEEASKPLFKVDKATGQRFAEAPDPNTGGMIQQPLGMDPVAANAAAIAKRQALAEQEKQARTFQADQLRLQQNLTETEFAPIKERFTSLQSAAKKLETGTQYEQRADGTYEVKDDFAIRISDMPDRLVKAQAWLNEKKRITEELAKVQGEHDPIAARIHEMQVQRDKLAIQTLADGHRSQVEIKALEDAAKRGVPVWQTETQRRLSAATKDPQFTRTVTEGQLADEANPILEDVQRATRNPVLDGLGSAMGTDLQLPPDGNAIGSNLTGSALDQSPQELNLRAVLETLPKSQALPDAETAAKELGIPNPQDFNLVNGEAGPTLVHTPTGGTAAFVDAANNRVMMTLGEITSTPHGQAMARDSKVPIFVLAGQSAFTPSQRRDYMAGGISAAMTGNEEAVVAAGADIKGIRGMVRDGKLSVQDGQWMMENIHGITEKDLSMPAIERDLEQYAKSSQIETGLWQGKNATPETRAAVVDRFFDNAAQNASGSVLFNGGRLEELRAQMKAIKAKKSVAAIGADFLADTSKMLVGSLAGLGVNAAASIGETLLEGITLGEYEGSERFQLFKENTVEWFNQASGFANRVLGADEKLRGDLQELRNWAVGALPGDEPPPELVAKIKETAFNTYHRFQDDEEAKARVTSPDTFDVTKDPALGQYLDRYLSTRNSADWSALSQLMTMDGQTRALTNRVSEYVRKPRAATIQDVQDRASQTGLTLGVGQAQQLLDAVKAPIKDAKQAENIKRHIMRVLGFKNEADALLALDMFTGDAGYDQTSLTGYFRSGMQAPAQEIATEAVSTFLGLKFGQLAARGALEALKGTTVAATRSAMLGRFAATSAASISDDFARLGMFSAKFGQPLTRLQRASNAAVAAGKGVLGDAASEGIEEGVMGLGEPGSTVGTVMSQAVQGMTAAPVMVGGMALLSLPAEIRQNRSAARDWEKTKLAYLGKVNERLNAIPGTPAFTPEEFEQAVMIYGSAAATTANDAVASAFQGYQTALSASPRLPDGSPMLSPDAMQAQQLLTQAVATMQAREALTINAALELREIPDEQRVLFTAVAKAAMGVNEFTVPESQALIRLSGPNRVSFVPVPSTVAPQRLNSFDALPSVTLLPGGRVMLAPGAVPMLPAAIITELSQSVPSLGQLVQNTTLSENQGGFSDTSLSPEPAVAAPGTPEIGAVARTQDSGASANAAATTALGVVGPAQGEAMATPAVASPVPTPAQATSIPVDPVKVKGITTLARRVIGETLSRVPKLKGIVKEAAQPPGYATGGMWMQADGTIAFHLPTIAAELAPLNLPAKQIGQRVAALLDEEIRHAATMEASRRLWEKDGKPWDFETWRDAWYGDIWANQFTEEMRQKVMEAYGETLPEQPWMRAMEGLRMLDQLRATGSITEAVLRHLEAVVEFLRDTLQTLTPTIKSELEAMQAILQEFGYEQGRVKPEKAKKQARKVSKKAESNAAETTPNADNSSQVQISPDNGYQSPVTDPAENPAPVTTSEFSDTAKQKARAAFEGLASAPVQMDEADIAYAQAIDDVVAGTYDNASPIEVGDTPAPMLLVGAAPLKITMPASMVRKVTQDVHDLSIEVVKGVSVALKDPIFVFRSATQDEALTAILDITHKGNNVLVALHLNKKDGRHEVNRIASIYDKSAFAIQGWIRDGQLAYIHTKKGRAWFRSRGLQLPKEGSIRGNPRLKSEADLVKVSAAAPVANDGATSSNQRGMLGQSLFSAPAPETIQVGIPKDRFPAFLDLASTLVEEKVTTPEKLAAFLDEVRPDGSLMKYAQALWDFLGIVNPSLRGTHNWEAVNAPTPTTEATSSQKPKRKRGQLGKNPYESYDILDWLSENPIALPPKEARKGRGEYDWLEDGRVSRYYRQFITSSTQQAIGAATPDTRAQEAYDFKTPDGQPAPLISEPSADALSEAIVGAIGKRQQMRAEIKRSQRVLDEQEKQRIRFDKDKGDGDIPIDINELYPGDALVINGESLDVTEVAHDEDGYVTGATLRDGTKYGVQFVNPEEVILVDQFVPTSRETDAEDPFSLDQESDEEMQARLKTEADRQRIAERQNASLTGTAGEYGTSDMFDNTAGPMALFNQPLAKPEVSNDTQQNDLPGSINLERDQPDSATPVTRGESGLQSGSGSVVQDGRSLDEAGSEGGDAAGRGPVPANVPAALGGETGRAILRSGKPRDDGRATGDPRSAGSGDADAVGVEVEQRGEDTPSTALVAPRGASNPVDAGSEAGRSIKEAVPILTDEQAGDVAFIEARLAKAAGVLLTNGTGTGKTFSGLGAIKRMLDAGKQHILVLAPSDKVVNDWVAAGKRFFEIEDIGQLPDTQSNGAGSRVVVTTYANIGQNNSLAGRPWDAIVTDESHYLSQSKEGNRTEALDVVRALTLHADGGFRWADMTHPAEAKRIQEIREVKYSERSESMTDEMDRLTAIMDRARTEFNERVERTPVANRPKVLMLSATPFAYHFSLDYAEGYLFDFPKENTNTVGRYNHASPRSQFYMDNFGYRMRVGKLTTPENATATGILERRFAQNLMKSGAMAGRTLQVEQDYGRHFVVTESALGNKLDEIMNMITSSSRLSPLLKHLGLGDYLARRYLLEALKAREAINRIKQHLALGRKVVVFHDYKKGGSMNPLSMANVPDSEITIPVDKSIVTLKLHDLYRELESSVPGFAEARAALNNLLPPLDLLERRFPQIGIFNGDVPASRRRSVVDAFNTTGSDMNVILVQRASGKEGISLHDRDGKHQRVFIDLGIPGRPTDAIQSEGRVYRLGVQSNAVIEYLTTGTNWERWTFAQTIAQRASTAENLAMGERARALLQSFATGYNDAEPMAPSLDQGTGGKERDKASLNADPFKDAVALYYTNAKKTSRNKAAEGIDYYPTAEPLGFKMVEWAEIRPGEKVLEPSAGHGAIARFFPDSTNRHAVEPSNELAGRLALNATDVQIHETRFESYHIGNKFDVIVMNPPFGTAGKTAMDHLVKATQHLRQGGRIVALIPEGSSMEKRYEKWMDSDAAKGIYQVAEYGLPNVAFERAGTSVKARVVILDKAASPELITRGRGRRDFNGETVEQFFESIKDSTAPRRVEVQNSEAAEDSETQEGSKATVLSVPSVTKPNTFTPADGWHAKEKKETYVAKIARRLDSAAYGKAKEMASKHGGYYSAFKGVGAVPGFQFKTAEERDAFIAETLTQPLLASAPAPGPQAQNQEALKEALGKLQPIWRTVLEASMKGTPVEQIAKENDISIQAVGNILRVAQGRLQFLMDSGKGGRLRPTVQVEDGKVKAAAGEPGKAMGADPSFVAVDQRRARPEEITHAEMQDLAQQLFETDPFAAEKLVVRWMDSGTTVLSLEGMPAGIRNIVNEAQARQAAEMLMTAAAKLLVTEKSLAGGDAFEIARLIDLYRTTGTEQARALSMRQDPHQNPEERAAMFIAEALLTPPSSMRDQIRRNPANKERILKEWAAKAQDLKAKLKAAGYDIDASFAALRREQAAAERVVPAEVKVPLAKANGRTRTLVRAVLEGKTWREAADAAKMTLEQARAAYTAFRQQVNDTGARAAQAARDALLSSAPVSDFASQIGLPEWTEETSPDATAVETEATEALKRERAKKKESGSIDLSNPVAVARTINALMPYKSSTFDKISEFWRASILSGPQTQVVNLFSGLAFGAYEATVKKLGAGATADIARMFGMETDAASLRDIPAMLAAVVPSVKRAFADAIRAWKAEASFFNAYALDAGRPGESMVKADMYEPALKGAVGKIMRGISFRLMLLADEFVKSFFTRIEVAAQARQIARTEGFSEAEMSQRISDLMRPGSEAWVRGLDQALKITFQTELGTKGGIIDQIDGIAAAIQRAKKGDFGMLLRGVSHFVFPFVATPTNIFKMGVTMSPLGTFLALVDAGRSLNQRRMGNTEEAARLYNAARLFDDVVNQIVAWGTVFVISELVQPGEDEDALPFVTGSLPWKATSEGVRAIAYRTAPPTSVRIGDRWYSYGRLDPFASALAFMVDSVKEFQKGAPVDEVWGRIGIQMLTTMQDKTFLQGFSDLMNAIQNPERFGTRWATNIATGFIPNLLRQPVRAADENIRESDLPNDMPFWQALATRVGYSVIPQMAPPAIDVWGREEVKGTGSGSPQTDLLLRLFSPVQSRGSQPDPLDVALLRYNMTADKPFGVTAPDRELSKTVNGVTMKASMSDEEWQKMMRDAGNASRLAIGSRFNGKDLSDEDVELIKTTIQRAQALYREQAKRKAFAGGQS